MRSNNLTKNGDKKMKTIIIVAAAILLSGCLPQPKETSPEELAVFRAADKRDAEQQCEYEKSRKCTPDEIYYLVSKKNSDALQAYIDDTSIDEQMQRNEQDRLLNNHLFNIQLNQLNTINALKRLSR
ncbi:MAG: hypothetical protein ACXW0H_10315 [Methylobacter sp.]